MKQTILIISMLCCGHVTTVFTQGIWSLDFYFGYGVSNSTYRGTDQDAALAEVFNRVFVSKKNVAIGTSVNKKLSKNAYLKTGLRLSNYGYTYTPSDLRWPSQHDGNGGFDPTIEPDEPISELTDHAFSTSRWFFGIPINLRLEAKKQRFTPYVEGGFFLNYYMTTRSVIGSRASRNVEINRNDLLNSLNVFGNMSIGINCDISDELLFYIQAGLSHQLNNLLTSNLIERQYHMGMELGVRRLIGETADKN